MQAEAATVGEEQREESRPSLWRVFVAVLSAFFGVRKRLDHESVKLEPVHVIVVGVIAAALFVVSLLLVVKAVLS